MNSFFFPSKIQQQNEILPSSFKFLTNLLGYIQNLCSSGFLWNYDLTEYWISKAVRFPVTKEFGQSSSTKKLAIQNVSAVLFVFERCSTGVLAWMAIQLYTFISAAFRRAWFYCPERQEGANTLDRHNPGRWKTCCSEVGGRNFNNFRSEIWLIHVGTPCCNTYSLKMTGQKKK